MTAVATISFAVLAVAGALCVGRLLRHSTLADRVVALDVLVLLTVTGVAVDSARTGEGTFLDLLVVASLLGFVGTIVAARFIEDRGS
jgi:multicomponent Na+:H+ antiporter subunit F